MPGFYKRDGPAPLAVLDNAAEVGIETTTYVCNICKYYASYALTMETSEKARAAVTTPAR